MGRAIWVLLTFLTGVQASAQHAPERLIVGGDANYPPFEWLDEDGRAQGFNVELMTLLAGDSVELEFRLGAWPDTIAALDSGQFDVVPMFVSDLRRQSYRFTNIYAYQTHALFARAAVAPVDSVERLNEIDLVVERNSLAASELLRLGPIPELVYAPDTLDALRRVERGEVRYALLAAPVAEALIDRHDLALERKSAPIWPRGYAYAVLKNRPELAGWLQQRLVEVMGNGQYLELYERWAPRIEPGSTMDRSLFRLLIGLLAAAVVLVAGGLIWNFSLRGQVARRTSELNEELEQRRQAEQRARTLARRDSVTGLSNIYHFCLTANAEVESHSGEHPCEVMLIRLHDLETVIRSFGYKIAERMLLHFSDALRVVFREPIAHLGRGTFAVLDCHGRVPELLEELEQAVRHGGGLVRPRFIAGSAAARHADEQINELLHKAELALTESQRMQLRWTRFSDALQVDPLDIRLLQDIREHRFDGLGFAVQPQLRLADRTVVGGELLARWKHPEFGEIAPARFVALLEGAGLIGVLTERALEAALDLIDKTQGAGRTLQASVNVSTRDLIEPAFADQVARRLEARGIDPAALKMEITETSLVQDPETVRATLDALVTMGVSISLDDFGTGYSSLDYISRFPIDEVKVDGAFVGRMLESERDLSIVRSTIALGHEMGMKVVGEGAETDPHVDKLAELNCDLVQGWAVGYPESPDDFLRHVRSGMCAATNGSS